MSIRDGLKALSLYLLVTIIFHAPVALLGKSYNASLYQPHGMV